MHRKPPTNSQKALLLIDLQIDYFPGGKFPLWNTDAVLDNVEQAIRSARAKGMEVIHIHEVFAHRTGQHFKQRTVHEDEQ